MLGRLRGDEDPAPSTAKRPSVYYLSHASVPSRDANAVQVVRMCAAMVRQSVDVVLYCRRRQGKTPSEVLAYYGIRERIGIRGVWHPPVPILGRVIHSLLVLARLLVAGRPTLYYGRDPYALALVAICPLLRAPIVFEAHRPPMGWVEGVLYRTILRSSKLARVVVISDALGRELGQRFGDAVRRKTVVARDGADPVLRREASEAAPPSGFQLGYIGSLAPGKGMEMITKLAPLLPDCLFHVVGGSPEEVGRWRRQPEQENLVFHGYAAPSDAQARLRDFDAMLAPYQEEVLVGRKAVDVARWMSPLKIFEYMAAGKPIVASDLPVLREFLQDGKNALLAPASDERAWVEKIRALQTDRQARERLGSEARREFLEAYTWDHRASRVLGLDGETRP